jgi:hypothetical protein
VIERELGGIRRFRGNETLIVYCAGGKKRRRSHSLDAGCGCAGRWQQSHQTRPVANPSFSSEGKLHRHVRRCHTRRGVITVDRPVLVTWRLTVVLEVHQTR